MTLILSLLLTAWPANDARLTTLELPEQPARKVRLFIDAGHGAPGNTGNHGCACQLEQDHTLKVAQYLGFALSALGRFEVKLSRQPGESPPYRPRIAAAEAFKADVIISLHSDARGDATFFSSDAGLCLRNPNEPGFSVLWSEEGPAFPKREQLGRTIGAKLREAGFLAYSGLNYASLYKQDEKEPSGWIDQRPLKERVFILRGSQIPTVIIETHHALDEHEVARWDELATIDAFTFAIASALLEFSQAQ